MILSIYGAYDNLSHNFIAFTTTPKNDGLAVRNLLSSLRVPLKDTQCICLGSFDSDPGFVSFEKELRIVDWSCYKFPETVADALSPLGVSDSELSEILANKNKNKNK